MVLRVHLSDRLTTTEIMTRMGSRTVRTEALVGHARLHHDTLILEGKVRYLGTYDWPKRINKLPVTGGKSLSTGVDASSMPCTGWDWTISSVRKRKPSRHHATARDT